MKKQISLILLLRNGSAFLPKLLRSLGNQDGDWEIELVVVDSESTDGSLKLISNNKSKHISAVKIIKIKAGEFNHGGTRNLAVKNASHEIIILLSQDALPQDNNWLQKLMKPLAEEKVAGVFGRQVPWPETNAIESYFYTVSYPSLKKIITKEQANDFSHKNLFFSNVNAAVKKTLLLKFPFREDLLMSEDQFWGREVLRAGYKLVYEPEAVVFHSHNYNLSQLANRYFVSGRSQKQLNLKGNPMQQGLGTSFELLKYLAQNKPWFLPYSLVYLFVKGAAFFAGKNF